MSESYPVNPIINKYIEARLGGMRQALVTNFNAGRVLSSASKGNEREAFVKGLLGQLFSPAYRFGTGDITSSNNQRSGQVDIVVESPYWYSLPIHPDGARLYMAEGVAAVIEVKSDLASQWDEVLETIAKVKCLKRRYRRKHLEEMYVFVATMAELASQRSVSIPLNSPQPEALLALLREEMQKHPDIRDDIPCYAVGYVGWKSKSTFFEHFTAATNLDGAIILDPPVGCFRPKGKPPVSGEGEWMLSLFLDALAFHMAEISRMEMTQGANYMFGMMHKLLENPEEAYRNWDWKQPPNETNSSAPAS